MRFRTRARLGFVAGAGLLMVGVSRAQQDPQQTQGQKSCAIVDENGKTVIWPNCQPPAEDNVPSSANDAGTPAASAGNPATRTVSEGSKSDLPVSKQFPFPGEPLASAPPNSTTSATPASSGGGSDQPVSKRFPFPGEPTADASTPAPAGGDIKPMPPSGDGLQDAGSSGSSSSSSSSSPEGGGAGPLGGDDDEAAKEAAARKAARHKLPPVARQSPDEREAEDLKVASFYMDDKNFKGAYLRATDAVSVADDDAEAHYALAEAARKLGKLDEAMRHYKKCLTLDPVPKTKRAADKALKEMSGV